MKYTNCFLYTILILFSACSNGNDISEIPQVPGVESMKVEITTRTENPTGENPLQAGLYMVNYCDGQPDELLANNNYVNNWLLTWANNGWSVNTPIYWNDENTCADFYAYAPYQNTVVDARHLPFSIQTDQSTAEAYVQSDFQWGKIEGQSPSNGGFSLTLKHILCQLKVKVTAEGAFGETLSASDFKIFIGGSKPFGMIDLATGDVEAEGEIADIQMFSDEDLTYKAVLLPQSVAASIQIHWLGKVYTLQKTFVFEAGRKYNLTVSLKQPDDGLNVGIVGWDVYDEDFGGTAE